MGLLIYRGQTREDNMDDVLVPSMDGKPPADAIRGVWIPDGRHCPVLKTKPGIEAALDLLQENGFNAVFPAVWNRGTTAFPSRVMQAYGLATQDKQYMGIDPLEEIVQAGRVRGMRVIPWFEYGFASAPDQEEDTLLKLHPDWAARDPHGAICKHGHLYWMNALHPEVQTFISELILEVVRNYAVTGIQGDDRFPAMPRHSGYDELSQRLYKSHSGDTSTPKISDAAWCTFRCEQMTQYLGKLVDAIRAVNPKCLISMAPAPMPFGKTELMQDSHQWLQDGLVDWLHPQIYRQGFWAYRRDLNRMVAHWSAEERARVAPGLALFCNQQPLSPKTIQKMMMENRRLSLGGEVFFHYGWITKQTNPS